MGHSGTAVGSTKIYYFGGYGIRIGYVNETHVLDTALLSWSRPYINGAPPAPRVGHTAIVIGTKLYVIGGAAFGRVLGDLHVLDTTSMSWIEPPTAGILPGPLYGHTAVAVGRCIFVFGGASAMPTQGGFAGLRSTRYSSNRIHVLDVDTMTWSKPNVAGVTPLARHRHATCVVGSQLFMFGGVGGGAELYALDTGIMDDSSVDRDLSKKKGKRQGGDKRDESGNELIAWLEGLGLGKYTRVFIRQEVDFETLVELTPADLREMGIAALGPRKKLAAAISSMKGVGQGKFSTADLYQGRYKLEESTSMGGLNLVKLAIDMKTERKVALKFMADKEGFVREVAFLKALRSEFVVELVDYYEDPHGKQHCVVLEYGEQSLADYLKKGALQRNERKFIADRLANVALHLHSHNVVHCDLKPHNLVLFGLKWKVIDLESARRAGEPVSMKVSPVVLLARARARRARQAGRPDARVVRLGHVVVRPRALRALRAPAVLLGQARHDAAARELRRARGAEGHRRRHPGAPPPQEAPRQEPRRPRECAGGAQARVPLRRDGHDPARVVLRLPPADAGATADDAHRALGPAPLTRPGDNV